MMMNVRQAISVLKICIVSHYFLKKMVTEKPTMSGNALAACHFSVLMEVFADLLGTPNMGLLEIE